MHASTGKLYFEVGLVTLGGHCGIFVSVCRLIFLGHERHWDSSNRPSAYRPAPTATAMCLVIMRCLSLSCCWQERRLSRLLLSDCARQIAVCLRHPVGNVHVPTACQPLHLSLQRTWWDMSHQRDSAINDYNDDSCSIVAHKVGLCQGYCAMALDEYDERGALKSKAIIHYISAGSKMKQSLIRS